MFNAVVFSLLIWEISYSAGNFLIISLLQFPLELSIFLKFLLSSSFTLLLSFYLSKSYMLKKVIFKSSKKTSRSNICVAHLRFMLYFHSEVLQSKGFVFTLKNASKCMEKETKVKPLQSLFPRLENPLTSTFTSLNCHFQILL